MSAQEFVPKITEKLDFTAAGTYLAKHGVISPQDCSIYNQQLLSRSSTNADVMHKVLPKILQSPREFYRALRESVSQQHVNFENKKLFELLPKNFVSLCTIYFNFKLKIILGKKEKEYPSQGWQDG